MCEYVNINKEDFEKLYESGFFRTPEWYYKHSWTEKDEKEFSKWLKSYLKENKDARISLMTISKVSLVDKFVDLFLLNYGWKQKEKALSSNG